MSWSERLKRMWIKDTATLWVRCRLVEMADRLGQKLWRKSGKSENAKEKTVIKKHLWISTKQFSIIQVIWYETVLYETVQQLLHHSATVVNVWKVVGVKEQKNLYFLWGNLKGSTDSSEHNSSETIMKKSTVMWLFYMWPLSWAHCGHGCVCSLPRWAS